MSTATRRALDDAIRAHLADEAASNGDEPDFIAHWVIVAGFVPTDEAREGGVWVEAPDGQAGYVTRGLLAEAADPDREGDD